MSGRSAEAKGKPVTFTYEGESYTVAPQAEWPLDVAELIEDQKFFGAARAILGNEQWGKFKAAHTMGDVEPFFAALGEAIGGNPT